MIFDLIVPPTCETVVTGVVLAGQKRVRGVTWRCEARTHGGGTISYSLWRNGAFVSWDAAPETARKLAQGVASKVNQMRRLNLI